MDSGDGKNAKKQPLRAIDMPRRRPRILFEKLHPAAIWPKLALATESSYELYGIDPIYKKNVSTTVSTGIGVSLPTGWTATIRADPFAASKGLLVDSNYVISSVTTGSIILVVTRLWSRKSDPDVLLEAGQPLGIITFVRSGVAAVTLAEQPKMRPDRKP